ncbi:MAG: glycoside hydrolase family 75 protein [Verrucomicrobiales bacterium]
MSDESIDKTKRGIGIGRLVFFILLCGLIALPFTPIMRKIAGRLAPPPEEKIVIKEVEVPEVLDDPDDPLPTGFVRYTKADTERLWSEIDVSATVEAQQGGAANLVRKQRGSYEISYKIKLTIPEPSTSLDQLAALNPELPKMLPGLESMMETAKVSGFYHKLYELKQKRVQQKVMRLHQLLSRHHMFDCETVLELTHPETSEKALLIQGEMDVVSDGSDGDRVPEFDAEIANSDNYQPFTSYYWKKVTDKPNPMLPKWESRLADAVAASKSPGLSSSRLREAQNLVAERKNEVARMKTHSWLIARADPFIVIPLSLHAYGSSYDFGPRIGDYAVVIHGNKLFPAIVGDAGPSWLTGEASLRMAKEINPKATPYNRPESDLEVTYLIFPKSRDWPGSQPDYAKWRAKCAEYLGRLGGIGEGYSLHEWEDVLKPNADASTSAATQ